ncbi:hypothetical protein E2C01_000537 [Portunus trituberculatus]|uniref:Uncharacterized protein n=1 Tax=Portunus trituberculatus TaxID=210409 RepID=A0A5B7CFH6_PORTR|nr:hypothetical protein [Portunus trituberculatus]
MNRVSAVKELILTLISLSYACSNTPLSLLGVGWLQVVTAEATLGWDAREFRFGQGRFEIRLAGGGGGGGGGGVSGLWEKKICLLGGTADAGIAAEHCLQHHGGLADTTLHHPHTHPARSNTSHNKPVKQALCGAEAVLMSHRHHTLQASHSGRQSGLAHLTVPGITVVYQESEEGHQRHQLLPHLGTDWHQGKVNVGSHLCQIVL